MRQSESKTHPSNGSESPTLRSKTAPDLEQKIAEKAYLIAEARGFEGDHALDDWLKAEAEVNQKHAAASGEHVLL